MFFFPCSRPNPFDPTSEIGFGIEGQRNLIGLFSGIVPDFHFERKLTWLCGDHVALLSKVTGTIKNIEGYPELPMFPGIPSEKLLDKKFVMHAMDLQIIRDGKVKHEYHMENFAAAVHQMLNNEPVDDLGFEEDYIKDSDSSDGSEFGYVPAYPVAIWYPNYFTQIRPLQIPGPPGSQKSITRIRPMPWFFG